MNKQEIGKLGEDYAKAFLESEKYDFITANYHCRFGEIDLVFFDYSNGEELVFVEVKSRTSFTFGYPSESITKRKKERIYRSCIHYIQHGKKQNKKLKNIKWRIDAIFVIMKKNLEIHYLDHIKNILDG